MFPLPIPVHAGCKWVKFSDMSLKSMCLFRSQPQAPMSRSHSRLVIRRLVHLIISRDIRDIKRFYFITILVILSNPIFNHIDFCRCLCFYYRNTKPHKHLLNKGRAYKYIICKYPDIKRAKIPIPSLTQLSYVTNAFVLAGQLHIISSYELPLLLETKKGDNVNKANQSMSMLYYNDFFFARR